jgi:hypothetical protein
MKRLGVTAARLARRIGRSDSALPEPSDGANDVSDRDSALAVRVGHDRAANATD